MGADLFIAALVIDQAREPDFAAAKALIERLGREDVELPDEFYEHDLETAEGIAGVRCLTAEALDDLECGLVSREVEWIDVRGARVFITGGMSWGDSPTQLFETITRLRAVRGILAAAGFEDER